MSTGNVANPQADLQKSIFEVGMLTYLALISMDTELRSVVLTQLQAVQGAAGSAPAIEAATKKVTDAMSDWGFPQSTIDQVSNGNLAIEANYLRPIPNGLPNGYGMSGCTSISVKPALSLLK